MLTATVTVLDLHITMETECSKRGIYNSEVPYNIPKHSGKALVELHFQCYILPWKQNPQNENYIENTYHSGRHS